VKIIVIEFAPGTYFFFDQSILCSQAFSTYFLLGRETSFHPYKTKDEIACSFVHFKLCVEIEEKRLTELNENIYLSILFNYFRHYACCRNIEHK
jgi:hypothetical protein